MKDKKIFGKVKRAENGDSNKAKAKKKEKEKKNPRVTLDSKLEEEVTTYNSAYADMNSAGESLHVMRMRSVDLIMNVETLVNSIACRPKAFDKEIAEIQNERAHFVDACEFARRELEDAKESVLGAVAGAAAGTAIVSVAPSAAMWVATTFGTASTGTAISALSGAAATNAALAWLGGGALAANGGGMAAGHALLALAGPVGWGVAGATLLTSITLFALKRMKSSKQKKAEIEAVIKNTQETKIMAAKIEMILEETTLLRDRLSGMYTACLSEYGKNFTDISENKKIELGTIVNNTKALATTLSKVIQ